MRIITGTIIKKVNDYGIVIEQTYIAYRVYKKEELE